MTRQQTMLKSVTPTIYYMFCSDLSACTTDFLLVICKIDRGRTTGQTRGPITKAIQEIKSFLEVAVSLQKLLNQTKKTIKAIEK